MARARAAAALVLLALATRAAAGRSLAGANRAKGLGAVKSSDKCTPFAPPPPFKTFVEYAHHLSNLTDSEVDDMYYKSEPVTPDTGFPLAGCTLGWVPGGKVIAQIGRLGGLGAGWSGKCFGFAYDAHTGTPTTVFNAFGPKWRDQSLTQSERVKGVFGAKGNIVWVDPSAKGARVVDPRVRGGVWRITYEPSEPLYLPQARTKLDLNSIVDEVRAVPGAPGAIIGRAFVYTGGASGGAELPVSFMLFQACAKDGRYATRPGARALPRFGRQ